MILHALHPFLHSMLPVCSFPTSFPNRMAPRWTQCFTGITPPSLLPTRIVMDSMECNNDDSRSLSLSLPIYIYVCLALCHPNRVCICNQTMRPPICVSSYIVVCVTYPPPICHAISTYALLQGSMLVSTVLTYLVHFRDPCLLVFFLFSLGINEISNEN